MITIEVSEQELGTLIKALHKHANRKRKSVERWQRKKETGLIVPLEVADHFISLDTNTAEILDPIIQRLECANAGLS